MKAAEPVRVTLHGAILYEQVQLIDSIRALAAANRSSYFVSLQLSLCMSTFSAYMQLTNIPKKKLTF